MGKCLNICERYETTHNRNAYARGFKYCAKCRLFINFTMIMCPCCNGFLRTKSHQPNKSNMKMIIVKKRESRGEREDG